MNESHPNFHPLNLATYTGNGLSCDTSWQALAIAKDTQDELLEAESYICIGLFYGDKGQSNISLEYFQKAREIFDKFSTDSEDVLRLNEYYAHYFTFCGVVYDDLGRIEESYVSHQNSWAYAQKTQNTFIQQRSFLNLGLVEWRFGKPGKAIDYVLEAISERFDSPRFHMTGHTFLSHFLMENRLYEDAYYHAERAVYWIERRKDGRDFTNYLWPFYLKAILLNLLQRSDQALVAFEQAEKHTKTNKELTDKQKVAYFHWLGLYYFHSNHTSLAYEYLRQSLEIAERLTFTNDAVNDLVLIGAVLERDGRFQELPEVIARMEELNPGKIQKRKLLHMKGLYAEYQQDWQAVYRFNEQMLEFDQQTRTDNSLNIEAILNYGILQRENSIYEDLSQALEDEHRKNERASNRQNEVLKQIFTEKKTQIEQIYDGFERLCAGAEAGLPAPVDEMPVIDGTLNSLEGLQKFVKNLYQGDSDIPTLRRPQIELTELLPVFERIKSELQHHTVIRRSQIDIVALKPSSLVWIDTDNVFQAFSRIFSILLNELPQNSHIQVQVGEVVQSQLITQITLRSASNTDGAVNVEKILANPGVEVARRLLDAMRISYKISDNPTYASFGFPT